MILIGLGGKLRSGKDAVADRLVSEYGFAKVGMSDPLHEALLKLDPIVAPLPGAESASLHSMRYSNLIEEIGYVRAKERPEVRRLLQTLGTNIVRDMIDVDAWTRIMGETVRKLREQGRDVVVSGIRFPNEAAKIRQLGGDLVWVTRPAEGASAHESEDSIRPQEFDFGIPNIDTLDVLYSKVDNLVEVLEGAKR